MADAQVSKTCEGKPRVGSTPTLGTHFVRFSGVVDSVRKFHICAKIQECRLIPNQKLELKY
jgi:hypothetical protein